MKLTKDQDHGKAYGTFTWRGKKIDKITRIGSTGKKQWSVVSLPDYKNFVPDSPPPMKRKIKVVDGNISSDSGNDE